MGWVVLLWSAAALAFLLLLLLCLFVHRCFGRERAGQASKKRRSVYDECFGGQNDRRDTHKDRQTDRQRKGKAQHTDSENASSNETTQKGQKEMKQKGRAQQKKKKKIRLSFSDWPNLFFLFFNQQNKKKKKKKTENRKEERMLVRRCLGLAAVSKLGRPLKRSHATSIFQGYSNEDTNMPLDRIRNIGIIAHVDAGKTTTSVFLLSSSFFS